MTRLRVLLARLLSLFFRGRLDVRLDEEMRAHLELATEDNIARGMTVHDARLAALRSFGGVTQTKEAWRDVRGLPVLEALWQDLRYAVRTYRKTPAFTLVALLTLTLAIGANTAIFSLLNALVLRDLPVRDPASLVQIATVTRTASESPLTFPMFQELTRQQQVLASVIGWWGNSVMAMDTGGERTNGVIWAGTGNVYSELGVRPIVGRLLTMADMNLSAPSAEQVAVLGYRFWQRHYGGDTGAVGRTIRVEGVPFVIVGVAPPEFMGFGIVMQPDVTIPLTAVPLVSGRPIASIKTRPASQWVRVIGRLKPDVTIEQARAHLNTLWPGIRATTVPADYVGARRDDFLSLRLVVGSAANGSETALRSRFTQPLWILMGIAGLILLIACVNLASLTLARATARSHEIGVRLALGASRWRVARQLLTEGVLLSTIGGALGVMFAFWSCRAITALIFDDYVVTVAFDASPDPRVIAVATVMAIVVGLLFSLAPVWRVTQQSSRALQSTRTASGTRRPGRRLVTAQVALSLILLTNATLLVRSLAAVRGIDSGLNRTDRVHVAYPAAARPGAYAGVDNDSYYPAVLERLAAVPGVLRASISLLKPGDGGGFSELVAPAGESSALSPGIEAMGSPVSPGFFDAVGIAMVKGRDFNWADSSRTRRVTVISQSLARRLFGDREAIGQHLRMGLQPERQDLEVVGVAADARLYDVKNPNVFAAYIPALQDPAVNFKCFVVKGIDISYPALKQAVESLGRENVGEMVSLRYITDRALLQERLTAMLSGFFGALALLLAGVGLFGLMSYTVARQRREIGIRMALGAEPRRVMADVVRDGIAITLTGVAVGFALALASVQLVKSLLFGVTPHDPLTLVAAPVSLLVIAVVACLLPASRAARVDPMIALRAE
jgi:putative ABC transport system permease protein